jgi:hypothetical protein
VSTENGELNSKYEFEYSTQEETDLMAQNAEFKQIFERFD